MQRIVLIAVTAVAFLPTFANAGQDVGEKDNGLSICEESYLKAWDQVLAEKVGPYNGAAGRNVVQDGVETKDGIRPATEAECKDGLAVMDRMLNPPPVPEPVTYEEESTTSTAYAPAAPTSSGGCPASMAAEADSPTDVNPTSGAAGCYQVIPSTAAAMGDACADVNSPDCLAAICASQGNGAWAASGATPC